MGVGWGVCGGGGGGGLAGVLTITLISIRVVNIAFKNFIFSDNTSYVRRAYNHVNINARRQRRVYEHFLL